MAIDRAALVAGSIRFASGVSFLVDPLRANRWWGEPADPGPSARLLLRSMGYRDALIGGLLLAAGLRGRDTRGWFLASGGADAADLLGGAAVHRDLTPGQRIIRSRRRRRRDRGGAVGRHPAVPRPVRRLRTLVPGT